jgi:hypothetical protein
MVNRQEQGSARLKRISKRFYCKFAPLFLSLCCVFFIEKPAWREIVWQNLFLPFGRASIKRFLAPAYFKKVFWQAACGNIKTT